MNEINELLDCIVIGERSNVILDESFDFLKYSLLTDKLKDVSASELTSVLTKFPPSDQVSVSYTIAGGESISIASDKLLMIDDFLESFRIDLADVEVVSFVLEIKIKKNFVNNTLTVYNLQAWTDHLNELTLDGLYYSFNKILKSNLYIHFNLQETNHDFYTNTFYFSNSILEHSTIDRQPLINKRIEMCNILNGTEFSFIPEDFRLIKSSAIEDINILMNNLCILTSIMYIVDISNLETNSNVLTGRINGYKSVMLAIDFKPNVTNLPMTYFIIYQWIYNSGNFSDKIGLSRNIITLQIKDDNILLISENTINSIKSSHELYLKKILNNIYR